MAGYIIVNGIIIGAFNTESGKWKCVNNYLRTYNLAKAELEIRTEAYTRTCVYSKAECEMEMYRTEIAQVILSWRRGLLSERELEKCKLEIRKKWFEEFIRHNFTSNISMLTAEILAEKSMELSED